jgi:hypothetical protein
MNLGAMQDNEQPDTGWAERAGPKRAIRLALYTVCALLVLAEFFVDRHPTNAVEALPVFYVLYGFLSLIFAVIAARGLRRLVRRHEGYYDHDA